MEKIINAQITKTSMCENKSAICELELYLKGADGEEYVFGIGRECIDIYNQHLGNLGSRGCTVDKMEFLIQVLKVVGVSEWGELPGKYVRIIITERNNLSSYVSVIGNLMKDRWLDTEVFWEEKGR